MPRRNWKELPTRSRGCSASKFTAREMPSLSPLYAKITLAIMSKRGTLYILGAGASYISPLPEAKLPLQKGFFPCIFASDFVPQKMVLEACKTSDSSASSSPG